MCEYFWNLEKKKKNRQEKVRKNIKIMKLESNLTIKINRRLVVRIMPFYSISSDTLSPHRAVVRGIAKKSHDKY